MATILNLLARIVIMFLFVMLLTSGFLAHTMGYSLDIAVSIGLVSIMAGFPLVIGLTVLLVSKGIIKE